MPKNPVPLATDQQTQNKILTFYAIGDSDCHLRFSTVEMPARDDFALDLSTYIYINNNSWIMFYISKKKKENHLIDSLQFK